MLPVGAFHGSAVASIGARKFGGRDLPHRQLLQHATSQDFDLRHPG